MRKCNIEGCDGKHYARGWCAKHYMRWRKHGDTNFVLVIHGDDTRKFFGKVKKGKNENDCHIWIGAKFSKGYGMFRAGGKSVYAHRHAWEIQNGAIPEGMHVLHNCFNKACVNPAHLRLGTNADNLRDWDRVGDRHARAKVPDAVVVEIVKRYKAGGVSYRNLAKELTERGWPTNKHTVWCWVKGLWRSANTLDDRRSQH